MVARDVSPKCPAPESRAIAGSFWACCEPHLYVQITEASPGTAADIEHPIAGSQAKTINRLPARILRQKENPVKKRNIRRQTVIPSADNRPTDTPLRSPPISGRRTYDLNRSQINASAQERRPYLLKNVRRINFVTSAVDRRRVQPGGCQSGAVSRRFPSDVRRSL